MRLRPASPRVVDGYIVRPAFLHEGPARDLVHALKYRGIRQAARILATAMAPLLPPDATCLVPIPRVLGRRLRLGIDPGVEIARALGAMTGLEVVLLLDAPLASMRHAGRAQADRTRPSFSSRGRPPDGAVVVDDVVTTGSTLEAAFRQFPAVGLSGATATSVPHWLV